MLPGEKRWGPGVGGVGGVEISNYLHGVLLLGEKISTDLPFTSKLPQPDRHGGKKHMLKCNLCNCTQRISGHSHMGLREKSASIPNTEDAPGK